MTTADEFVKGAMDALYRRNSYGIATPDYPQATVLALLAIATAIRKDG